MDGPGGAVCLIVVRDITEQKQRDDELAEQLRRAQAERAEAEHGARQYALLAEVSGMLTGSLDYETTLPAWPAWSPAPWPTGARSISSRTVASRRLVVAHVDPALESVAQELQERPLSGELPEALARVLADAHPEWWSRRTSGAHPRNPRRRAHPPGDRARITRP